MFIYFKLVCKHWLFAEEVQEHLRDQVIPFDIRGIPVSSSQAGLEGRTAKTVSLAKCRIDPQPNQVVVTVVQRGKPTQISIDPSYLVPWRPSAGNKVLVIGHRWIGQVGKLVELKHGCCTVELEHSGKVSYFKDQDVVNLVKK